MYKVTDNEKTSTDDGVKDDDQDEPLIVRTVTNFLPHCKLLEVLHTLELQQFCEKTKRKNQRDIDVCTEMIIVQVYFNHTHTEYAN